MLFCIICIPYVFFNLLDSLVDRLLSHPVMPGTQVLEEKKSHCSDYIHTFLVQSTSAK